MLISKFVIDAVNKVFQKLAGLDQGIYGLVLQKDMQWLQLSTVHDPPDIVCGTNSNFMESTAKLLILNIMKFFHLTKLLSKIITKNQLEEKTLECYNFAPKSNLESPLFFSNDVQS